MKMMHANQTKTVPSSKVSRKEEKRHKWCYRQQKCATTRQRKGSRKTSQKYITKPAKELRKSNSSSKAGWTGQDRRGPRGQKHTGSRHVLSPATDVRRKYNVECIQSTIRGHGGTQSMVGPGQIYLPDHRFEGPSGRRATRHPDKYYLREHPPGARGPLEVGRRHMN
jgi:hypothetical protein